MRPLLILAICLLYAQSGRGQAAVHLHLDRSAYAPGDTLWFAAYTVGDTLSETLYAELVNAKRETVGKRLFRVQGGWATGFWPLSDTLGVGPYRLRAYTRAGAWTETYGSELIWLTSRTNRLTEPPPADSGWVVQTYPEGGHLISKLPASVVVRVTDPDEQGVPTQGLVTDEDGNEVVHFKTDTLGLARVYFTPELGKNYRAKAGATTMPLPPPRANGVSLRVNALTQPSAFRVRLFRSQPVPDSLQRLRLLAMVGDSVYFDTVDSSDNVALTIRLPFKGFPAGVVRFVVLDGQGQTVAERFAWGQLPELPRLTLTTTPTPNNNQLQLMIQVADSSGRALRGRFSVVVTDSLQTAYTEAHRASGVLRTYLPGLATSLRHPALLWPNTHANRQRLDQFLTTLTHWPSAAVDSLAEQGIMVEGVAVNDKKKPLANQKLLLLDEKTRNVLNVETNERGYFGLSYPIQQDTVSLWAQRLDEKNRPQTTQINWLTPPTPTWQDEGSFPALARVPGSVLPSDTTLAKNWVRDGEVLQMVQVRGRRRLVRELYIADFSVNTTDQYLEKAGVITGQHLINYLSNQPAFIQLAKSQYASRKEDFLKNDPFQSPNIDPYSQPVSVMLLVDNRFYGNTEDANQQLMALSAYDIERVEIVRAITKPVIIVSGQRPDPRNFIIAIITRMGPYGSGVKAYSSRLTQFRQAGYSRVPVFRVPERVAAPTLYWNPELTTNDAGRATLLLNKPTQATTLQVVVEGITENGLPVSANWRLSDSPAPLKR